MLNDSVLKAEEDLFDSFLSSVAGKRLHQARFMNALSYLEYVGARKILKSQPSRGVSLDMLTHASEEMRHAKLLKKTAVRLGEGMVAGYAEEEMLCGAGAKRYFQSLDRSIAEDLRAHGVDDAYLCYSYATLLIEERALMVYPKVAERFGDEAVAGAIRAILAEEELHLREVSEGLEKRDAHWRARAERLRGAEAELFRAFALDLLRASRASADGRDF